MHIHKIIINLIMNNLNMTSFFTMGKNTTVSYKSVTISMMLENISLLSNLHYWGILYVHALSNSSLTLGTDVRGLL